MKLLFCHPNQRVSFDGVKARPMVGPPLGILSIASYIRESQWQGTIEVYDARLSAKFHINDEGESIFGDTDEEILAEIRQRNPDVIGVTNMFTSQVGCAYRMADLARIAAPNATIVIGGPHVSVFPLEAIERLSIDYAVIGEGEERLTQLLMALEAGESIAIQGVVAVPEDMELLRSNKRAPIKYIETVDELPFPAYDLLDLNAYYKLTANGFSPRFREWGKRPMTLLTSRGCPHKCNFCSIQSTMGYKFRYHSPEYVQRHIDYLVENYGIDFIHFEDDNFTHIPERYDEIIDYMTSLKPQIKWDTPNGVRGDTWSYERVKRAKDSGCQFLTVAIESAVPEVLNNIIRKRLDLEKAKEMIRHCDRAGLRLHAFYIIGFPGETIEQMKETVDFALKNYWKYGTTPFLQPLIPIPGTDVYDQVMEEKLYQDKVETQYNQITTDRFKPEDVQKIYKDYLHQRMRIFVLRSLFSLRDMVYNVRLVIKYPQAVVHALKNAASANG